MPFKSKVSYLMKMKRCGYYCIRQQMLANGASLADIASVLAMRLRMLGDAK